MKKRPTNSRENGPLFVTWDEKDTQSKALAFAQLSKGINDIQPVYRSHASTFRNIGGNGTSIRDSFNRRDYDFVRPRNALPKTIAAAIDRSGRAYDEHGIIRNVFDMMSDFTIQGINIFHPNEKIQDFYRNWFKKVNGVERSERFVNLLFKHANIIVQRATAKISTRQETTMRTEGADLDPANNEISFVKREIPWRYTFLHPLSLELVCPDLATLIGVDNYLFQVRIPQAVKTAVLKKRKSASEKAMMEHLPDGLVEAINSKESSFPLDADKVRCFFYRKDDWDPWAKPLLLPVFKDLDLLERMKLADLAALDGVISSVRIWKLGSLEHKIMPTPAGLAKLSEMLMNNIGGGVMDLVWDAAIDLKETSSEVYKFLGDTKYGPVLRAIFVALGIPASLVGGDVNGGMTNNAMALKTLIERMNYARSLLIQFWDEEIRIVQKAMGFRFPATLGFDRMTLMDESQQQALMIQLLDRVGMSVETIQEIFGLNPEIEKIRTNREERRRTSGKMPRKAGPYHPDTQHELRKIVASSNTLAPSELGLELPERKDGELSPAEMQNKLASNLASSKQEAKSKRQKGRAGQGRPLTKKDTTKRKEKVVRPRTSASQVQFMDAFRWAEYAQASIADLTSPAYLASKNKKSMRELTAAEAKAYEDFKFHALFAVEPFSEIEEEKLFGLLEGAQQFVVPAAVSELVQTTVAKHAKSRRSQPSVEMVRRYQSGAFACFHSGVEESGV